MKSLHLVLVVAGTLGASAFGMWCMLASVRGGGQDWLLPALLSFGAGLAMVIHGVTFFKKTGGQSWL